MILFINNSDKKIKETHYNKFLYNQLKLLEPNLLIHSAADNLYINTDSLPITGIILSGSPLRIVDEKNLDFILNNLKYIKNNDIPLLGICFGMQLLSILYNSDIGSFKKERKGHRVVNIDTSDYIFSGIDSKKIHQYVEHYDYVIPSSKFHTIATDSNNNCYGIKHKIYPFYGLQFHPEKSGKNGIKILQNFINLTKNIV